MCTVCGCAGDGAEAPSNKPGLGHDHDHEHDHDHHHDHHHDHDHHHSGHRRGRDGTLDFGAGPARAHVPGQGQTRLIEIERDILSKNDAAARENRARLASLGVTAVNLMSSPGAGKTTLLVETIKALSGRTPVAVIEGDQQTSNDAARIREAGAPAVQVNTGKGCHLDADMVAAALDHLPLPRGGLLFIENVGNLVCPASFDLGEARRVVLASVTEGEDKPLKYPEMFATADAVVVTKTDLLPYLEFDAAALIENALRVRPNVQVLKTSVRGADGLTAWLDWLCGLATAPAETGVAAE